MPEKPANVHVTVPEAIQVEAMLALNRCGGVITTVRSEGKGCTGIGVTISKESLVALKTWLQDHSGGQGRISEVPQ